MSTSFSLLNDTSTSSNPVINISDVISTMTSSFDGTANSTDAAGGCGNGEGGGGSGSNCTVTQSPPSPPPPGGNEALCTRLAPPPVPPWLRDSPGRLYQMTKHCKSWSLYRELCTGSADNSTFGYPRYVDTGDDGDLEEESVSPEGLQWVIPALALVVLLLLLLLALLLYKNYRRPHKKSMYRVSGAGGYRFKPPQTSGSWTGGPLVESETSDSYLGHPSGGTESGAGSFRYSRSPVCRLLEQTQYVATPTEDEHRPRPPTGPPAFTSPAYFLPALAWLRLPLLRHSWPGEPNGAARDTTRYNAAQPAQCDCGGGETTHHWRPESWVESRGSGDNDPEYSEILEGGHSHYSSLNPTQPPPPPLASTNGIGPYEYEMQERSNNNNNNNNAGQARRQPYPLPPQRRNTQVSGHEHRYEKLWAGGGEADSGGLAPGDLLPPPNTPGTCENGWLSRYRLPSPIFPATDPPCRRHVNHLDHADCGATADDLTSDSELLPCDSVTVVPSDLGRRDRRSFSSNGRSEVKYPNPVYEGCGRRLQGPPAQVPSPLLSRLLGYISWNKR